MSKLILMSILIALITVPTRAAREPDPKVGLKRAVKHILIFEAFYAFALIYLWGRW
jgi:hypothetical protein